MNAQSHSGPMRFAWAALLVISVARIGAAADHFLTIGGGDSPAYNQVSLEKNVLFFQHLLGDVEGAGAEHDIFFSDGLAGSRDIQFVDEQLPKVNSMLARLFNQEDGVSYQYRPHQIPGVRGPSTRRALESWFSTTGARLGDGDRLFIYFTGHGGPGNPPHNTTFSLWNERAMTVWDFTALLDRLSPKVNVVLVMVQCHAGGFADVIFNSGRFGPRLSSARRCGFFATTPTRNAAGCTADAMEDDYKDYSTYFFAALGGKTRTGKEVESADYDGDGHVSFAEAHAYTVLNSQTIDLPLTTSDVFLRQFSKTRGDGLVQSDAPLESLASRATPAQRAVLEGLAERLKLPAGSEVTAARQRSERLAAERKDLEKQRDQRWKDVENLASPVARRLTRRWPELSSPWNRRVPELLRQEGSAIEKAIQSDRQYARFDRAYAQFDAVNDKDLDLEHQWAACQRFIYTAESVALAANLEQAATPNVMARYRQILSDEAGTFPGAPPR